MRTAVIVLVLLLAASLLPAAEASGGRSRAPVTWTGDRTINQPEAYTGDVITLSGNLFIVRGGSLTLDNSQLRVASTWDGQYRIEVQSGGTLVMRNGALLTADNPNNNYRFAARPNSTLVVDGSTVSECGAWWWNAGPEDIGPFVSTSDARFTGSQFISSRRGLVISNSTPVVEGSAFYWNGEWGLTVMNGAAPRINGSYFGAQNYGLAVADRSAPLITNSSFVDINWQWGSIALYFTQNSSGRVENSYFSNNRYSIYIDRYSTPAVRANAIVSWLSYGLVMGDRSAPLVDGNYFLGSGYAVYASARAAPEFANNAINSTNNPWWWTWSSLYWYDAGGNITNNTLWSGGYYGMYFTYYSNPAVARNTVVGKSQAGINVENYATPLIDGGTMAGNGNGVQVNYYGAPRIRNLSATFNTNGVSVTDSSSPAITGSNLSSNSQNGIAVNQGSSARVENTTITGNLRGVLVLDRSYAAIYNATIRSTNLEALRVEGQGAGAVVERSYLYSQNMETIAGVREGAVVAGNSTIQGRLIGGHFFLGNGGYIGLHNSSFDRSRVTFNDDRSFLEVFWSLSVRVAWAGSGAPANGANLTVTGRNGSRLADGALLGNSLRIEAMDYSQNRTTTTSRNPYSISAEKNQISSTRSVTVSTAQNILMELKDSLLPALEIAAPAVGAYINSTTVRMSGTASDAGSGLKEVRLSVDGANWVTASGRESWNGTLTAPNGDGPYLLKASAVDVAGNPSLLREVLVNVDTVPPAISRVAPAGNYTSSPNITFAVRSDAGALVLINGFPAMAVNDTFSADLTLYDGPNTIVVRATDAAGNTNTATYTLILDRDPPPLRVLWPANGSYTNRSDITIAGAAEPGASATLNGRAVALDAVGGFSVAVSLVNGTNTFILDAVDAAGNRNGVVLTIYLDAVPPAINHTTPVYTTSGTVTLDGTLSEEGVVLTANGRVAVVNGTRFTFLLDGLEEGASPVLLMATDRAGNTGLLTVTVIMDTHPPFIVVREPANGTATNGMNTLIKGFTEPGARLLVNGTPVPVDRASGEFAANVTLAEGRNLLVFSATDGAGNSGSLGFVLVLDRIPPGITFRKRVVETIAGEVLVAGTTEAGAHLSVNGMPVAVDAGGNFAVTLKLSHGKNPFAFTVRDDAGNEAKETISVERVSGGVGTVISEGGGMTLLPFLVIGAVLGVAVGYFAGRRWPRPAPAGKAEEEHEPLPEPDREKAAPEQSTLPPAEAAAPETPPESPPAAEVPAATAAQEKSAESAVLPAAIEETKPPEPAPPPPPVEKTQLKSKSSEGEVDDKGEQSLEDILSRLKS